MAVISCHFFINTFLMKNLLTAIFSMFIVSCTFAQEKAEGLFINSKIPDFKAKDQNGNAVNLRELRKKGNVVVVFYRGNWSPFCMRFLLKLQDSLQYISNKHASLVAITPEAQEGIDSTVRKTGATFPIIFDEDMKITSSCQGIVKMDDRTISRLKNSGVDILALNHQKEATLPVPAVYILNKEGSVTFRYFDEDPRKRITVDEILKNL